MDPLEENLINLIELHECLPSADLFLIFQFTVILASGVSVSHPLRSRGREPAFATFNAYPLNQNVHLFSQNYFMNIVIDIFHEHLHAYLSGKYF